ncbi:MAG: DUF6398 domain-containing protein [Bacteroidota bacterium]
MATDKEKLNDRVLTIDAIVSSFCKEKLNDEYKVVLDKVIGKLKRKRPSPLLRGKESIWAAGIIHAIGHVNFLGDRSFEPYATLEDICDFTGTKKSSVGAKAADIRKMLKMNRMTSGDYMVDSRRESNPFFNMVMVDGFMMPVSALPPQYQEMVREAAKEGKTLSFTTK